MKKLMIAAAVACAAMFAQASSADWSITGNSTLHRNKAFYVFDYNASYTTISAILADASNASIGTSDGKAGDIISNTKWTSATIDNGVLNSDKKANGSATVAADGAFKYFAVVFNNENAAAATKYYIVSPADGYAYSPNTADKKVIAAMSTFGSSVSIATAPIPEPTSGLLLLLGVAGLALRRRRA